MNCEAVRDQLPDHTLGTVPEIESAAIRRHLRGCAACREDAADFDRGLALFASASHSVQPPAQLKARVLQALSEEWKESPSVGPRPPRWPRQGLIAAAAAMALVAALAWGSVAQRDAERARMALERSSESAREYEQILSALGGKDFRVALLRPVGGSVVEGTAVLYDAVAGRQSWVLVLARAPGYGRLVRVKISSSTGRSFSLPPIRFSDDGDGSTLLVTSSDISAFREVELLGANGARLAFGTTGALRQPPHA